MSDFFNCKEVSAKIDTDTAQKIEALAASDVQVRLALFQIGDNADESAYASAVIRKCGLLGVEAELHRFPEDVTSDEYLAAFRKANGNDEVDGLLVLLNTVGGDIEAGLGIAELIASMSKPTVSLVLGGGHSIGVPLAVSAKRSFIAPSAAMTIHPVRLNGLVIAVSQTFNYFARIQERIIQFVTRNSRVKREDFTRLMLQTGELAADVGSVIYGEEAVRLGLIDEIGGLSDALACLHQMMDEQKTGSAAE